VKPIGRAALEWLCRELAPGGRVARVRPMHGGLSCSIYAVHLAPASGAPFSVVVRRYREYWQRTDPAVCAREFRLLQMLARAHFPAPEPLLLDSTGEVFGAPTLVMTRLPGRATLQPRDLKAYVEQLARALALLHQLPVSGMEFLPLDAAHMARRLGRADDALDAVQERVWRTVNELAPAVPVQQRVIHGDFWPGNTVWHRGRLSGVIDWEMATLGAPGWDVATCRCDLNNLFDAETADAFERHYEIAAGAPLGDKAFWDLLVAAGAERYIRHWAVGYRALGRHDQSGEEAARRVRAFSEAALADAEG
jgi:aminoglycoside phosphotransferase (APT) family kinase protein